LIQPKEKLPKSTKILSKKPPLALGATSKVCAGGHTKPFKSSSTWTGELNTFDDKPLTKHKRQKSLPKQHFASIIETVGNQDCDSASVIYDPVVTTAGKKHSKKEGRKCQLFAQDSDRNVPMAPESASFQNGNACSWLWNDNEVQYSDYAERPVSENHLTKSHSEDFSHDLSEDMMFNDKLRSRSSCLITETNGEPYMNGCYGNEHENDNVNCNNSTNTSSYGSSGINLINGAYDKSTSTEKRRSWKNMFSMF